MTVLRGAFQYVATIILLIFSWSVVYLMNGTSGPFAHFFYFPITVASLFWGMKGGIVVGLVAGILSGPLMPQYVINDVSQPFLFWLVRLCFFVIFGVFTGKLFSRLNRKKKQVLLQNEDLGIKNKEIVEQRYEIIQQRNEIEKQQGEIICQKNEIEKQWQEIENSREQIREIGLELVDALVEAIEIRDAYTSGHCQRVSDMAVRIGKCMGLDQQELLRLKGSGMLHDIGKIGIPEAILSKEGKLTQYEYEVMKQHPLLGAKILSGVTNADAILEGVLHHHERMDGKGYPHGLVGEEIGLQARILAVADVWDALTSKRSYRDAMSYHDALKIMKSGRGSQFDRVVLDHFLEIIGEDYIKKSIERVTG